MIFHDITADASGRRRSARQHDVDQLEPGAVAVFAKMIRQHGPNFNEPIPVDAFDYIRLHFTAEQPTAAVATFYAADELATTSVLLFGSDERTDRQVLEVFGKMILRVMHDTGIEPGFDVDAFDERPAIVSVPWPNPKVNPADVALIADMETCLAAAFFGGTT